MNRRLTVVALLLCVFLVCALEPQMVFGAPVGPSVARYVMPDGRMDLEAMRASRYQGPLDLEGYDVRLDWRSGEPVVRFSGASGALENPDDEYWAEGFDFPGVDHTVEALTVYDNKLIAGGEFIAAGDVIAYRTAAWDGSTWSPLGSGMNSIVSALTVHDTKLIAGGYFTTAGDVEANYIAAWDGSTWSPIGSGMNGPVAALTLYDNKLIAGGKFTTAGGVEANYIAAWDGSTWSPLGSGLNDGSHPGVNALTVYDNKLIAGGEFTTAGGVEANYIAAWDGAAWSAMGSGMDGIVYTLSLYNNKLVAGGDFGTGGVETNHIVAWDGSTWSPVGSGINGDVRALSVYDNKLIAGGAFSWVGGVWMEGIAAWDGSTWSPIGSVRVSYGDNPYVFALAVYGDKLVAGGYFGRVCGVGADYVAAWDGSTWSALGSGINAVVVALTVYDGKLIAGGCFITAGGVAANRVAAWDGSAWSPLGSGMDYEPNPPSTAVRALTVYDNKLIAGGQFTTAGGAAANGIAAWNGSAWSPLAEGMNSYVSALTVYDDKLIAGGGFTTAGGVEAKYIAAWDGSTWSPLGSGMEWQVYALTVYDNKLIAGGRFTTAGGIAANYIAAWDGSTWSPLGSGVSDGWVDETCMYALTVYDNKLIAGGAFTVAGDAPANGVAAWDGCAWSSLGSGVNYNVLALTVYDNKLIAGGWFWEAGGVEALAIAAWDGSAWSPLASGIKGDVHALSVYNNTLMVGGYFCIVGDKVSGYIAQWTKHTSPATLLQNFAASLQGSAVEIEWELSEQVSKESFVIERAERVVERGGSLSDFVVLHGAEVTENGLHYRFSDANIEPGMKCRYRVGISREGGSKEGLFETEEIAIPALAATLFQNYPNPFNPSTLIKYYLPEKSRVAVEIYDVSGKRVAQLVGREQEKGFHVVKWNGIDDRGKAVASGVYFCRLTAGKEKSLKKIILLR